MISDFCDRCLYSEFRYDGLGWAVACDCEDMTEEIYTKALETDTCPFWTDAEEAEE